MRRKIGNLYFPNSLFKELGEKQRKRDEEKKIQNILANPIPIDVKKNLDDMNQIMGDDKNIEKEFQISKANEEKNSRERNLDKVTSE